MEIARMSLGAPAIGRATGRTRARACASVALALIIAGATGAQKARPDFLVPDPGFAELGALPDPLGPADLGRAALLASGVAPERAAAYETRLAGLYDELRARLGKVAEPAAEGEAILGFLHERVFTAYVETATTLDGVLDKGLYNCVSSAVLYSLAAKSLGLEVEGVRTSDHAFCSLLAGGRRIDVETTNPYGFDPGNKKEFKDSFGRATGYAYVAPGGYGDRKDIGDRALVGLILSNRASFLERAGRFAEAVRVGADYDELCRDADSRDFLAGRINNLVADSGTRGDFARAADLAAAAAAAYPGEARLAALSLTAAYNRAAALARSGDWAGAFDLATLRSETPAAPGGQAARLLGPDGTPAPTASEWAELASKSLDGLAQSYAAGGEYAEARRAVAERASRADPAAASKAYADIGEEELVNAANRLPFAEAERTADRVYAAGEVSASRYAEASAAIYGNEAGRLGKGGDWLGGASLAERGAAKLRAAGAPGDAGLAQFARGLRRNFAVEAHNRFAGLYNAGDYAGAEAEIRKALASLPGDPSLESDLKAATEAQGARPQ